LDEFLKQNYSLLTYSVEIIAALTGLICYKKYKHTNVKYFIWFLIYVVFIELIGSYPILVRKYDCLNDIEIFLKEIHLDRNYWFFTIFWIVGSALFYGLYFRALIKKKTFKRVVKYAIILFLTTSVIYYIINWKLFFAGRNGIIDVLGVMTILLAIGLYLIEMLLSDRILRFKKSINFYISGILIIWYLIVTPLSFYNVYFSSADWNFVILKYQIFLFANVFMYLTFTFALIYCKPKYDK